MYHKPGTCLDKSGLEATSGYTYILYDKEHNMIENLGNISQATQRLNLDKDIFIDYVKNQKPYNNYFIDLDERSKNKRKKLKDSLEKRKQNNLSKPLSHGRKVKWYKDNQLLKEFNSIAEMKRYIPNVNTKKIVDNRLDLSDDTYLIFEDSKTVKFSHANNAIAIDVFNSNGYINTFKSIKEVQYRYDVSYYDIQKSITNNAFVKGFLFKKSNKVFERKQLTKRRDLYILKYQDKEEIYEKLSDIAFKLNTSKAYLIELINNQQSFNDYFIEHRIEYVPCEEE